MPRLIHRIHPGFFSLRTRQVTLLCFSPVYKVSIYISQSQEVPEIFSVGRCLCLLEGLFDLQVCFQRTRTDSMAQILNFICEEILFPFLVIPLPFQGRLIRVELDVRGPRLISCRLFHRPNIIRSSVC